jgi:hypothetical protein
MIVRMGIDIAVRARHQASLADERGEVLWSGHRFRSSKADLDRLWSGRDGTPRCRALARSRR